MLGPPDNEEQEIETMFIRMRALARWRATLLLSTVLLPGRTWARVCGSVGVCAEHRRSTSSMELVIGMGIAGVV